MGLATLSPTPNVITASRLSVLSADLNNTISEAMSIRFRLDEKLNKLVGPRSGGKPDGEYSAPPTLGHSVISDLETQLAFLQSILYNISATIAQVEEL